MGSPSSPDWIVLLINYLARRSDQRLEAGRTEVAVAEQAQRAEEMTKLVHLGQALAIAQSQDGLRDVLRRHLPLFSVHVGGAWALIRMGGKWDAVAGGLPGTPHRASPVLEALVDRVLQLGPEALSDPEDAEWEGHVCFPLIVGETAVGVLGVRKNSDEVGRGDWRRAPGDLGQERDASQRDSGTRGLRRIDGLLQPDARHEGARRRVAARPACPDAALAHHVRSRLLQVGERSLLAPLR